MLTQLQKNKNAADFIATEQSNAYETIELRALLH